MEIDFYNISQKYFRGTITDEEEKLLSKFLQENEQNHKQFEQWSEEWHNAAQTQATAKTSSAWENLMKNQKKEQHSRGKKMYWYWSAAAVVLLLIGFGLWMFLPKSVDEQPFMAQTNQHEQQSVTLPDGTLVTLNGNSKLTYSSDFGKCDRIITFEGEGVFDVQKDATKPFIINVGDYSVTVLGTHFNLSAYQQDEAYTLALIEGSVKIKYKQDSVMVQPDESVRFDRQTTTFTKETIQAASADAWTQGKLAFDNIPLQDLARKLERIYDVNITFADSQVAQEKVYISVSTDEPFADVCTALEALLQITIKEQDGTYIFAAK